MYLTYKLLTLPIGTPAEDRHAYTFSPWQLKTSKSTRSHVCSALTDSNVQCPGVMLGFTGDGAWAHLAACASRDENPWPRYETWNTEHL